MTTTTVVMIIIGLIMVIASFFITEHFTKKETNHNIDLMAVDEDYEFSEREQRIIKRKIEDAIANQAKDILYETNESLASMANEKTIALGDYAVAVCDEIGKNHKEVMFLYSMLEDKQKEIMKIVQAVSQVNAETKRIVAESEEWAVRFEQEKQEILPQEPVKPAKQVKQVTEPVPMEEDTEASSNDDIDKVFEEMDQTEVDFDEALEQEFTNNENSNDVILDMYRNGDTIIDIAKQLGLGVGEVKLVVDLYQGE